MKAVLVIDMPTKCTKCELCSRMWLEDIEELEPYCEAVGRIVPRDRIDDECPLRPLPEKITGELDTLVKDWEKENEHKESD